MKRAVICLIPLLLLSGCGEAAFSRELEDTMLVQVLGVDWTEDGVILTAACDPESSSGGARTGVLSARGETLEQAKAALRTAGEERISLTHVAQLVLGEGTPLDSVLYAALDDPALGQGATIWLTEAGTARELLNAVDGGAKRLASIELNSGTEPVPVLKALMRLEERGWVELPALRMQQDSLSLAGTIRVEGDDG